MLKKYRVQYTIQQKEKSGFDSQSLKTQKFVSTSSPVSIRPLVFRQYIEKLIKPLLVLRYLQCWRSLHHWKKIKNGSEDKDHISVLSVYFGVECMDTRWARGQCFMNSTARRRSQRQNTSTAAVWYYKTNPCVCFDRDGHSATYFKTEDTLVEDADKVKILHDNDMYRFLHKHVQSDSDKRTECNASMQNAPCMDNLPYFHCEKWKRASVLPLYAWRLKPRIAMTILLYR